VTNADCSPTNWLNNKQQSTKSTSQILLPRLLLTFTILNKAKVTKVDIQSYTALK